MPHVGYRVAFEDADTSGQTPQEIEPRGKAASEIKEVYQYTIEVIHHITSERIAMAKDLAARLHKAREVPVVVLRISGVVARKSSPKTT